jgi:hypothetical protein
MSGHSSGRKVLRVLLSEGASTSAREVVTILGLAGHHVEICDPDRHCLARFSRLVSRFHRCPGLCTDPAGYLRFIETLLATGRFDVVLPTHEQGFLFARVHSRLAAKVGLALPDFANYRIAQGKADFSRLLDRLGLTQPATVIVGSPDQLRASVQFPCIVKTAMGTASRGVWVVRGDDDLARALREIAAGDDFANEVLVQQLVEGTTEKAQAVFCRGELVGFHAYRRIVEGAGGGEAIKQSVRRPDVRSALALIGKELDWHGALSIDYIVSLEDGAFYYIDCNPRLVEPMSAAIAGLDLVDLLLRVSMGETVVISPDSRDGVRTHLAMQALLGCALRGGSRRDIFDTCRELWSCSGPYGGSSEELTPVRSDWPCAIPLTMTALVLLVAPRLATTLVRRGWGAHLLNARAAGIIADADFA